MESRSNLVDYFCKTCGYYCKLSMDLKAPICPKHVLTNQTIMIKIDDVPDDDFPLPGDNQADTKPEVIVYYAGNGIVKAVEPGKMCQSEKKDFILRTLLDKISNQNDPDAFGLLVDLASQGLVSLKDTHSFDELFHTLVSQVGG